MTTEINGDARLGAGQRLQYLFVNLKRNLQFPDRRFKRIPFCEPRVPRTSRVTSPGRALTEAFIRRRLPMLLNPGPIRVLEIGCGSGSLTELLAASGYSGDYVGVDISNRFRDADEAVFARTFVQADVQRYEPEGQFDLVISVSALEHIPEDHVLTAKLGRSVAPGGVQLHFVPSGWALPAYLWHGYRQYTSAMLARRFDPGTTTLYAMGGAATFLLHFVFISVGEFVLGVRLRRKFAGLYAALLDGCLRADRALPICATTYAVCRPAGPIE